MSAADVMALLARVERLEERVAGLRRAQLVGAALVSAAASAGEWLPWLVELARLFRG